MTTTDERAKSRADLQLFLEEHVYPLETTFLSDGFDAVSGDLERARGRAREEGWWAPQLPRSLGGGGASFLDMAEIARVLGRSMLGHYVCNCQAPDAGNMELLADHGSEEQKRRFLEPLAAGEVRSCFAMTEPGRPGSNPTWLDCRAARDGDAYVIDGRKWFATAAEGAAFAVVMAVTDPEAPRHRRASMLVVPTDTPGYRLVRNLPVMGERGEGWASHGEVAFEECRVPVELRIGAEGDGFALAQERLGPGRIHHCMRWLGIADRALELLCRRARDRQLTTSQRLADQQVVQHWIADSQVAIRAASLLVREAAEAIDAKGSQGAREEISGIKFHVAEVMLSTLDRAIQAHGALGVTDLTPLAWFWRHERAARIYDGPDEVHKMVVARETMKRLAPDAAP